MVQTMMGSDDEPMIGSKIVPRVFLSHFLLRKSPGDEVRWAPIHVPFELSIETFSIRFFMENRKPQFEVTRLQFHVAEISNFSKAFSSFLFSQNIIQYKNTYRNCGFHQKPEAKDL